MTDRAYHLAPWTSVARPHDDVVSGALDMGTYAANLARVFRQTEGVPAVYARPDRFFAATYLTDGLRRLLTDVLTVLADGAGDRVLQLRTPFGGGKTHTLVALLHLAQSRGAVGEELAELPDPGRVEVAVLSGEELDPLSPCSASGMETRTLWGELGAQLGRYELVAEHDAAGSAPGGDTLRQLLGPGPVLVLLDEVLVYVEKAMAVARGDSTLGRQAMLFVQALTEAVNGHPRAAMVYSLQASVGEAVGAEGLLTQLDHLVSRIDAKREPVSGDEVMRVVQRRLFADLGSVDVHREVAATYAELLRRQLQASAETDDARREAEVEARQLEERVMASYPLHPALLDLMYHRWGTLPSYQRTRGALQFLASATHALWQQGAESALLGPGDVDLGDEATRGAFFSQVGERERYTAVLDGDIVSEGSGAATVDRRVGADSPALTRLEVGTRMATAIMLYSFGTREGEEKGVLETDLVAATLVPGLDRNNIVAALHDLREEELFLHYTGRRYRFEPTANLTKLVRDEASKFRPDEVLEAVRKAFEATLAGATDVVVWPSSTGAIRDHVPAFTVAYLPPDWSPDAAPLTSFVEEAGPSKRTYRNALALAVPDRASFDRARAAARLQLAASSLLAARAKHGFNAEQTEELKEKQANAIRDLAASLDRAYATVMVPVRSTSSSTPYELEEVDLRSLLAAGRSLHRRVLEALSHRLFTTVTIDKLAALTGLGAERQWVRISDVVDGFFSFFEFPKLASQASIADAISRGVMDGRFAYATGLEVNAAGAPAALRDPSALRTKAMVATADIDLSEAAALLTSELAARLVPVRDGDLPPPELPPGDDDRKGKGDPPPPPPPGPTDGVASIVLRLGLDQRGLFGLSRALSWLRERSSELEVEVVVRATAKEESGYERVAFRNGVVEPLEEGDARVDQELA